jgi:hypothetical protein
MTGEEKKAHAETERHDLIRDENARHDIYVADEQRRWKRAIQDIEDVYKLRLGEK